MPRTCSPSRPPYDQEEHGKERLITWMENHERETLIEHSFTSVSMNVVFKSEDGTFFPNELGAARFSFQHGVIQKVHYFIDPGKLPVGSRALAMNHEPNHRIPIDGIEPDQAGSSTPVCTRDHYHRVLDQLLACVEPGAALIDGETNYFIFVKGRSVSSQVSQVLGSLKFLAEKSDNFQFKSLFHEKRIFVLDVTILAEFLMLSCAPDVSLPSHFTIANACDDESFQYCRDISCAYHDENECDNCALAVAIKVWYCISKVILTHLGIEPVAGKHTPPPAMSYHILKGANEPSDLSNDVDRSSVYSFRSSSTAMPGPIRKQKYFGPAGPRLPPSDAPFSTGPLSVSSMGSQNSRSSRPEDSSLVQPGLATSSNRAAKSYAGRGIRK